MVGSVGVSMDLVVPPLCWVHIDDIICVAKPVCVFRLSLHPVSHWPNVSIIRSFGVSQPAVILGLDSNLQIFFNFDRFG
jgi:hypothetical protein